METHLDWQSQLAIFLPTITVIGALVYALKIFKSAGKVVDENHREWHGSDSGREVHYHVIKGYLEGAEGQAILIASCAKELASDESKKKISSVAMDAFNPIRHELDSLTQSMKSMKDAFEQRMGSMEKTLDGVKTKVDDLDKRSYDVAAAAVATKARRARKAGG